MASFKKSTVARYPGFTLFPDIGEDIARHDDYGEHRFAIFEPLFQAVEGSLQQFGAFFRYPPVHRKNLGFEALDRFFNGKDRG